MNDTVARPPRAWEMQTVGVLAAVGTAALCAVVGLVTDLAARSFVVSKGASGLSPLVSAVVRNSDALDVLWLLVVVGYVVGYRWWVNSTREVLRRIGDTTGKASDHWTIAAWYLAIFLAFGLRMTNLTPAHTTTDLAGSLLTDAAQSGLRVIGLGFLLAGIYLVREQVRQQVASAGVHLRVDELVRAEPRPAFTAQPTTGLPPADTAFWTEVAQAATSGGAEMPVLASTGPFAHRWLLIPATGDSAAVRAELTPGTTVQVFSTPPAAAPTDGYSPRPAESYYGLLESADGTLTHQTVAARRLPNFLAQAATARRWGLYPADAATMAAVV